MGKYRAPLISKRKAADLRKRAIVDGTFGSFQLLGPNNQVVGGWNPDWDVPRKMFSLRPPKGHIRDRTREMRYLLIYSILINSIISMRCLLFFHIVIYHASKPMKGR